LRAFILWRVWQEGPPFHSDTNFMLSDTAIGRLTGSPIDELPLPAGLTLPPNPAETAATEWCAWRGVTRGEVHDANAFMLGGAGHAGLFSTINGVLDVARDPLRGADPVLNDIRTRQSATRTLGWEARPEGWSGGDACSDETIGRTGFTGTGLWIAVRRGIAWTLRTNRGHPTRHGETGIGELDRGGCPDRRCGFMSSARRRSRAAAVVLLFGVQGTAVAASMDDLLRAYPDALAGFDGSNLRWRDGTRMPVGDGRSDKSLPDKSMEEQLRHGSIVDQLRLVYPAGAALLPPPLQDPGRVRSRAFFNKMYGDCAAGEVVPKLVSVAWLPRTWGHTVSITSVNGVDRRLAAISRELDALPAEDKKYLYPPGGTYKCRPVADTGQTSMHGWGAAIDINPAYSDYWLWRRDGGGTPAYVNRIPREIVAVFERHGFIWGGRWAHFDTMHFEYRPELLAYNPKAEP
jgi:hypothetical protein